MHLSVWSSYFYPLSPEETILEFERCGYTHLELSDEHGKTLLERGDPREAGRAFGEFARAHHVTVHQGHLLLLAKLCQDHSAVEKLKKWLDLFDAIGIRRAVLHLDAMEGSGLSEEEIYQENRAAVKELTDYLKGRQLVICMENLVNGPAAREDNLLRMIAEVGSENLGICLDTGHLNLTEKDQRAFILKAGKHLKALHVADNQGFQDQHMIPYGRGNIDWENVARALREIGYSDLFNLEIPGERFAPLPILRAKLEYIRVIFDYLNELK